MVNRLKNVTVIESAVGSEAGKTTYHAAAPQKGGFSGLKRPSAYLDISTTEISVQITSLDKFTVEHNVESVDFLKVDVEGAEMMLIAGAESLLTKRPRPVVQFEFADGRSQEYGYRASEIATSLESRGFSWFEFAEGSIRPHEPRQSYSYLNLIGVPEERISLIKPSQRQ
jgi:FkbM family methyltransferase